MRKVLLACVMAASLVACSHRDRNTESSGMATPPAAQAQSQPANSGTSTNSAKPDWSNCEDHPYSPGPKKCND